MTYQTAALVGNVSISSDKQIYVSYYGASGYASLGGFYSGFIFKPEILGGNKDTGTIQYQFCFILVGLGGFCFSLYSIAKLHTWLIVLGI